LPRVDDSATLAAEMETALPRLAALVALVAFAPAPAGAGELASGDPAPPLRLVAADGSEVTLAQFRGKRAVVLAWFPKAFTPG
jgi:peroxiredoxin Q/BCP